MKNMIPVYLAFLAAAVAFGSAMYSAVVQNRADSLKDRQGTYASIMGTRHLRNQLVVSRFEALIFSDYHEQRWKNAGSPKDSFDFHEANRWMHRSEDLVLEIARTNQKLFEHVGNARSVFVPSAKLSELTERLYRFSTPKILIPVSKEGQDIEEWKRKAVEDLQKMVENEYGEPTDALLKYLENNMQKGL